jgi:hypothetical protein
LQQFAPFQHSAEYVVSGCKQLRLNTKEQCQQAFDLAILRSVAELGNRNVSAAKLSPKNTGKWQFGVRKALAWGGYAGQRSMSLVAMNGYSHRHHHHHHLLICSMAGTADLIVVTC